MLQGKKQKSYVKSVLFAAALGATAAGWGLGCQKGDKKSPLEGATGLPTKMTFKGTVKHGVSGAPIADAKVNLIKLLDATAIQKLIEYKKAPDGKGGTKNVIRVKLDAVKVYTPDIVVTTDKDGKFTVPEAEINTYLVYTYGPGPQPGLNGAYTVHFWGIEPETGELKLEKLIGYEAVQAAKSGKINKDSLTFTNDNIALGGGPVAPEPTPPPAPPPPPPPPAVEPTNTDPPAPTVASETRPEEAVPPKPANTWNFIKLHHLNGALTTGSLTAEKIDYETNLPYFRLEGELAAEPSDPTQPVYVVIQAGFDAAETKDCTDRSASARTFVYPVKTNGKSVEFKLVRPHPYFKAFFAKKATKEDGKPVEATEVSDTITVGTRKCTDAIPEEPFLATLTWDQDQADLDLHVTLLDSTKAKEEAQIETVNFIIPTGTNLQLDVDNVYGYGPENISIKDAKTYNRTDRCYAVTVHYYAGAKPEVKARVDVQYVASINGRNELQTYTATKTLKTPGTDYQEVMLVPPDCVLGPKTAPVVPAPSAEFTCDTVDKAAFDALKTNDARFYAEGSVGTDPVTFSSNFAATEKTYSQSYMPGQNGQYSASISARDSTNKFSFNTWLYRVSALTSAKTLTIGTDKAATETMNMSFGLVDNSVMAKTPNAYGSPKKACGYSKGTAIVTKMEKNPDSKKDRPIRAEGCFDFAWEDKTAAADCKPVKIKGRYKLKFPD